MEESLSSKFKEFMTALDHVKKYSTMLSALPDFAIILGLSVIAAISALILDTFSLVYFSRSASSLSDVSLLVIISLTIGLVVGVYWVNRKLKSVKVGQWKQVLDDGLPGVIKLLQELNWEEVFNNIRHAKLGSWLYGIAKIAVYWVLTVVVFSLATSVLRESWHFGTAEYVVEVFSLVFVLVLSKKDICNRYKQIGRLDMLFWELRWFESEYRGADFEA
jgi:hypothetical protein